MVHQEVDVCVVQRASELAPNVALFHANLGEMQRLAGRPRRAVESALRALALDPKMASALSNLGIALYELKDYAASHGMNSHSPAHLK